MLGRVAIYDTTLRDGCQGAGIWLSLHDKLAVAQRLDEFGVDYVEGGWPGANPKDSDFFVAVRELGLRHARVNDSVECLEAHGREVVVDSRRRRAPRLRAVGNRDEAAARATYTRHLPTSTSILGVHRLVRDDAVIGA